LSFLGNIHVDFYGKGTSAVDVTSGTLKGRPHGGVAILWRKSLVSVSILDLQDIRLIGVKIKCGDRQIAFLNVYLPVDCAQNIDDFLFYLSKIEDFMDNYSPYAAVLGDFNTNLLQNSHSVFRRHLIQHCTDNNLVIADQRYCSQDTFTFFSDAHHSVSWLDHMITNINMLTLISNMYVNYGYVSSDHFPLCAELKVPADKEDAQQDETPKEGNNVRWDKLSDQDLSIYSNATDHALKKIKLPIHLLLCDDVQCNDEQHLQQISSFYSCIMESLAESGEIVAQMGDRHRHQEVPGWNDFCKQVHSEAREAFLNWVCAGKPRAGPIFLMMKKTRSTFKLSLRQCKLDKDRIKCDKLAEKLVNKNNNDFWNEVKKIKKNTSSMAAAVGSARGEAAIAQMWKKHFQTLLNSTPVSSNDKLHTVQSINKGISEVKLTTNDIKCAIQKLKLGKSKGNDGLKNEHFRYASDRLIVLLTLCFNSMLLHGFMCSDMLKTVIVPIVKDKNEDLSSVDNYRPIALTTASSKLFELIILDKLSTHLQTHDNQFGFKSKHSTDMCVYILKQTISYFSECNSPLYVTYLDASKAFDRVNFYKLFDKLLLKRVPEIFVRLLLYWYTHQEFTVRWGHTLSECFLVSNGVRQGGVLSPSLFNVYMDDLSSTLNGLNVGPLINSCMVNHLMYADDIVILSPSIRGMQVLLSHCDLFANCNDIKFNVKKSKCMQFLPPEMKKNSEVTLTLASSRLNFVSSHSYLGVIISSDDSDDMSIEKQRKNLYARGNFLLRHFRQCSDDARTLLFRSYCTSFYCSPVWCNFKSCTMRTLKTAYNRVVRLLFNVRGPTSISCLLINLELNPFEVVLRKSVFSLRTRLYNSVNSIVSLFVNGLFTISSKLHSRWNTMLYTFS
jgi:hypothetical protein